MKANAPTAARRAAPSAPPTAPPTTAVLSFSQSATAAAAVSPLPGVTSALVVEVTVTVATPVVLVAVAEVRSDPMLVLMRAVLFEQQFVSSPDTRQQNSPRLHWSTFQTLTFEPPPQLVVAEKQVVSRRSAKPGPGGGGDGPGRGKGRGC